jgi:outer membrane protein TolC
MPWERMPLLPSKDKFENNLENSTRYKRSVNNRRLAENRVEEARNLAKPDIIVGVNYRQENVAPTNHFYHAQVGVVIPIIDRGQYSMESARAIVRKEEAMTKITTQELNTELDFTYAQLQANFESMDIFPLKNLDRLETSFKRAEDAFRKGQIDVLTFIQTDTQVHEYVDLAYTSRVDYLTILSQLEMLIGQKLEI